MRENLGNKLKEDEYKELREGILRQEAMPSMRLLQFSGPATRKTNVCAYNCSYIAPESFQDLAEIMYISMCGTGAGWSVESQNVQKFPQINLQTGKTLPTHVIPDSKEGWADALTIGMKAWAEGNNIPFDYSQLRPSGARLKTMGGKASGPEPLRRLLNFTREKILARQGRRLRNIDIHDIICMIGDCVVSGGVRRSAMISLSDLDDNDIRDAKKGTFYISQPQRMLANNSAVYIQKPSNTEFIEEWTALMKSGSGERGIFNRGSLANTLPERRIKVLKEYKGYFDPTGQNIIGPIGTNPCGEIILQSKQFCNLSEAVARSDDDEKSLIKKVRLATILGTYQASLTNFPYLSKEWKEHCQKEALLGVSITGQWDCPTVRRSDVLEGLKKYAVSVNKLFAERLGINQSTCITCVKPSGNVSQLVDASSGMHARHSRFYIRRVRISAKDPLFSMISEQGYPFCPEVGQEANPNTYIIEFPVKAPKGAIVNSEMNALEQLEHWKKLKTLYCEHNPSVTITVADNEWITVADWIYRNWDIVGGLSFLPKSNHQYLMAPYEEITEEQYEDIVESLPKIDFSEIVNYEMDDETQGASEAACVGGACELKF